LADHAGPGGAEVHIRVGIHSGEAVATAERYLGFSVHRAARIGGAAHGGQVLLSSPTRVQVAAVVGPSFPVRVLERAANTDDLDGDLTTLLRAEVVREVRRYPELECAFPHALLQQAALSTLTAGRRRELYGRVAAAFEEVYDASPDDHLERLAHYYAQAEDRVKTIEYLERAARRHDALGAPEQAARLREHARG